MTYARLGIYAQFCSIVFSSASDVRWLYNTLYPGNEIKLWEILYTN